MCLGYTVVVARLCIPVPMTVPTVKNMMFAIVKAEMQYVWLLITDVMYVASISILIGVQECWKTVGYMVLCVVNTDNVSAVDV
jgi:hypothetical protein